MIFVVEVVYICSLKCICKSSSRGMLARTFLPAATKLGQGNVFTGVCDSVHRGVCLSACWDTAPPIGRPSQEGDTPPRSRHHHPPKRHTPQQIPPKRQIPPKKADPPQGAGSSIRSMSGRYASYWNAFLSSLRFS